MSVARTAKALIQKKAATIQATNVTHSLTATSKKAAKRPSVVIQRLELGIKMRAPHLGQKSYHRTKKLWVDQHCQA